MLKLEYSKKTHKGHAYSVGDILFSPDGKTLASTSVDATIRLWDTKTGLHKKDLTNQYLVSDKSEE